MTSSVKWVVVKFKLVDIHAYVFPCICIYVYVYVFVYPSLKTLSELYVHNHVNEEKLSHEFAQNTEPRGFGKVMPWFLELAAGKMGVPFPQWFGVAEEGQC